MNCTNPEEAHRAEIIEDPFERDVYAEQDECRDGQDEHDRRAHDVERARFAERQPEQGKRHIEHGRPCEKDKHIRGDRTHHSLAVGEFEIEQVRKPGDADKRLIDDQESEKAYAQNGIDEFEHASAFVCRNAEHQKRNKGKRQREIRGGNGGNVEQFFSLEDSFKGQKALHIDEERRGEIGESRKSQSGFEHVQPCRRLSVHKERDHRRDEQYGVECDDRVQRVDDVRVDRIVVIEIFEAIEDQTPQ